MTSLTAIHRPSLGSLPTTPQSLMQPLPSPQAHPVLSTTSSSIYHTCRLVLEKLALVEGLQSWLDEDTDADPLSRLCQLCRRGEPLFVLFNALEPSEPLNTNPDPKLNQINSCKANVYHFLVACRRQLLFAEDELFTVTDLFIDDTNGSVKVVHTIDKILQILQDRGIIQPCVTNCPSNAPPKDTRDKVMLELVSTERKYVQDLESLQNYMRDLQQQNILTQDTVHYLFGNLNALVDFQRRFLIQLEDLSEKPAQEQHVGQLFTDMEEAFSVYEPYCANYYSAQDVVVQEAPKLQTPTHELTSYLIKPIQRICKYPLLMNELVKSTDKAWPLHVELELGLEAIRRVTEKINETQRKHENEQILQDLKRRVDDWKDISIENGGRLLIQDKLTYTDKGEHHEREYQVFLFEHQLLFCKESKESKNRLPMSNSIRKQRRRGCSLDPRGYIATGLMTGVYNRQTADGDFKLLVEWVDNEALRYFELKFRNEEQCQLWTSILKKHTSATMDHPTPTYASFVIQDDDADSETSGPSQTRSRSNSFSAQLINTLTGVNATPGGGARLKTSASNGTNQPLPPLPSSMASIQRGARPTPIQFSHYHDLDIYPSSPPPSNPSSPIHDASSRMAGIHGVLLPVPSSTPLPSATLSLSSSTTLPSLAEPADYFASRQLPHPLKVKLVFNDGRYSILVPQDISYMDLVDRVEQKLRLVGEFTPGSPGLRLKYRDEDGDLITINSNDDIQMAFDTYSYANIHLFVNL
ncbi:hypothetical protein DM01DRAFT_1212359 [Hesseltinella vesiculosa]|uniref:RhoGEF-domain-containing protein n=1 Tax=Hesseltinella vesiculosa TaxID=101127 RepID=A0A1X2G2L6_9FUNG|nr:hypothetical protein DM01DRAFT_1212359 [Hesseltinella vesiculosa]